MTVAEGLTGLFAGIAVLMAVLCAAYVVIGLRQRAWTPVEGRVTAIVLGVGEDALLEVAVIEYRTASGVAGRLERGRSGHESVGSVVRLRHHPTRPERSIDVGAELHHAAGFAVAVLAMAAAAALTWFVGR